MYSLIQFVVRFLNSSCMFLLVLTPPFLHSDFLHVSIVFNTPIFPIDFTLLHIFTPMFLSLLRFYSHTYLIMTEARSKRRFLPLIFTVKCFLSLLLK